MSPLSTFFSYDTRWWQSSLVTTVFTKEAKGCRETTQHSVLPCLAGGEGWSGDDLYCVGRAVPPAIMSYCIPCPDKELLSCKLLVIPAAAAGILLNVHKTPTWPKSREDGKGRQSLYSMTALWVSQREINWSFLSPELLSQLPVSSTPIPWQPNWVLKFNLGRMTNFAPLSKYRKLELLLIILPFLVLYCLTEYKKNMKIQIRFKTLNREQLINNFNSLYTQLGSSCTVIRKNLIIWKQCRESATFWCLSRFRSDFYLNANQGSDLPSLKPGQVKN